MPRDEGSRDESRRHKGSRHKGRSRKLKTYRDLVVWQKSMLISARNLFDYQDYIRFLQIACGALYEVQTQLILVPSAFVPSAFVTDPISR